MERIERMDEMVKDMVNRPIEDMRLAQLGFLVNDIEKTKKEFARFFGVEEPETVNSGEFGITKTEYRGEPAPKAKCYMTFFYFGDLQMELIQPNGEPSIWKEHLEQFGEGLHHISFNVKGMQRTISACEDWGMKLLQRGEYRGGNGRYAFMDALESLKVVVELLERDE